MGHFQRENDENEGATSTSSSISSNNKQESGSSSELDSQSALGVNDATKAAELAGKDTLTSQQMRTGNTAETTAETQGKREKRS